MKEISNKIKFPIFWKFAFTLIISVIAFGFINIYLLRNSMHSSLEKELDKRLFLLANIISERSLPSISYGDNMALYNDLKQFSKSDTTIAYIFILDKDNKLIAQTNNVNITEALVSANSFEGKGLNIKLIETKNFREPRIRDIAYPILNGELGIVRLGIGESYISKKIQSDSEILLFIIVLFLTIGLIGALIFSYFITKPVKTISKLSREIDLNELESFNYELNENRSVLGSRYYDELDALSEQFDKMVIRLKSSMINLTETQSALVQSERLASLGTLSAGVAHEINNPISGIRNCVKRILKNPENTKQNEQYLDLISEASLKIQEVVKHMLDFSRKQNIIISEIDLIDPLRNSIELIEHRVKKANILIKRNCISQISINGSTTHLEQVFVNLLLNAVDAIEERKEKEEDLQGEIEIFTVVAANFISIHFKDNGIGIKQNNKQIFDPFYTTKIGSKGTGLGLSVSSTLLSKQNATINFTSEENKGTEFVIEFPRINK